MDNIVSQQLIFRQPLPVVKGNLDYQEFKEILHEISILIEKTKMDRFFIKVFLNHYEEEARKRAVKMGRNFKGFTYREKLKIQQSATTAYRAAIARSLVGESYREFSSHFADSPLLQNFCMIDNLEKIEVPSKSTLHRHENLMGDDQIEEEVRTLIGMATTKKGSATLGLNEMISIQDIFLDLTCIEANIHYPVDWLLFRDTIRTLMKATLIIREEGLKHRMDDPKIFMKQINKLTIEMTHGRRKRNAKKERKRIVRLMIKLLKKVERHAFRHRDLLEKHWEKTTLCEGEVRQIIKRMNNVIEQLPGVIFQSYERIIGERKVKKEKKIYSLYEREIDGVIRGKAGAEIEFGNRLLITEQQDGLIVDWNFLKDLSPHDGKVLIPSLDKIKKNYPRKKVKTVTTDRIFDTPDNRGYLKKRNISNCICPRNINELRLNMQVEDFAEKQKRRGGTEARIGILKNAFIGKPLRSKGFKSRSQSISLIILTHNLWLIARKITEQKKELEKKKAA